MRRHPTSERAVVVLVVGTLAWLLGTPLGWSQSVRLKDETTFEGQVVKVEDQAVLVRLPREQVATVDGKALAPPLIEGATAPAFTTTDVSGQSHSVGAPQPRVTVLHFWVSWCPYCRTDAPKIEELHDQFKDRPEVQVVTVSLDQDRTKLSQFMEEHKVTYPVILAQDAKQADLAKLYEIAAFPVTFVIDAGGIIRHKVSGSFVKSNLDLQSLLTRLLPSST